MASAQSARLPSESVYRLTVALITSKKTLPVPLTAANMLSSEPVQRRLRLQTAEDFARFREGAGRAREALGLHGATGGSASLGHVVWSRCVSSAGV